MSAAISAALLAAFAALTVVTGLQIASQFHTAMASCLASGGCRSGNSSNLNLDGGPLVGTLVEFTLAVPAMLGMFLGAPLVARELEAGTGHFAWTQGVTRHRWLAVRVGWLLLAALVWGGAVGALVTWWSGPRNAATANAFSPGTFDVQGIMPAAYSLFAMALGIAAGTLIRRVLPALGVTLGGYFGVRLILMGWIRQHYMTAVTTKFSLAAAAPFVPNGAAWILGQGIMGPNGPLPPPSGNGNGSQIIGNGFPVSVSDIPAACHSRVLSCLAQHGYVQYVTYQPADRYWPFQFIEAGIFVAIAAAGAFARHPGLRVIIGHCGEMIPFMLDRVDDMMPRSLTGLDDTVSGYIKRHVWVTTSGMFSLPPLLCALSVFGADRVLFSVDYPFSPNKRGRDFLDSLPLSPADLAKVAGENAATLLRLP